MGYGGLFALYGVYSMYIRWNQPHYNGATLYRVRDISLTQK